MRSKQINFFVLPYELQLIELFFKEYDIKYIRENITQNTDYFADEIPRIGNSNSSKVFISKKSYEKNIIYHYENQKGIFSLDSLKSYTIEFNTGGFYPNTEDTLQRARLYFITSYFVSNGEVIEKDKDFVDWANKIFRDFKKKFLKKMESENDILFSDGVNNLLDNNGGLINKNGLNIKLQK